MKLITKLSLAMGTLTIFLCIVGMFSLYEMDKINVISTEITTEALPASINVQRMDTLSSDFRIQEVLHIYSTDLVELAKYEKNMEDILRELTQYQNAYAKLLSSPEEKRIYDSFTAECKTYMTIHTEIVTLSRNLETERAIQLLLTKSKSAFDAASKQLFALVELNMNNAKIVNKYADDIYSDARTMIIAVLTFSVLLTIGLTIFIIRSVLQQLGKDPGELDVLAQRVISGDYNIDDGSARVGVYSSIVNMVASLKQNIDNAKRESQRAAEESQKAMEAMKNAEKANAEAQNKTQSILRAADKLEEVVNIASSASSELSAQIEQSERGATEQASRVTETATAMEEMNSTVIEVAKNAGLASDVSMSTRQKAEAGAQVVQQAVTSIQQVQKQSLALKEDMTALSAHAQSISQIMSVISDIADQTNLLALNAAIEAARAGEAGRGFAVVADEVRKLAEKTMASTTDVGNAIRSIQQSTEKSMGQVDIAVTYIEEATGFANQSGKALSEIVSMVDSTADQVRAIATASEQQSASSEEINRSILQINVIATETARSMQESAHAVSELSRQTHVITTLIDEMKRT